MNFFEWLFKRSKKRMSNKEDKNEQYWKTKHPIVDQTYAGRPVPGTKTMAEFDVRRFFWANDCMMKNVLRKQSLLIGGMDDTALAIQKYVVKNLKYVGDDVALGSSEFWLFPAETMTLWKGDCEDGALLIGSLLTNALPVEQQWRVRVAAGWVQPAPTAPEGGHGYCTYCRDYDNEWVVLDWCFYEDTRIPVISKPMQKDNAMYKDVWFSFNNQFAWSHVKFDMGGRVRKIRPLLEV